MKTNAVQKWLVMVVGCVVLSLVFVGEAQAGVVLISHTFDGGAGVNLNGTSLDVNTIGAGTWNAGLVTETIYVDANGNVVGGNAASAWVGLNGAITMGSPDDIYELEIVADHLGASRDFEGGFWGPSNPSKTGRHVWQGGTAWWLWPGGGTVTGYAGPGQADATAAAVLSISSGPTLLTMRMDLTDATLSNNSISLYIGDSATGTLVGSANFSGDESFDEVGISGRPIDTTAGRIISLTLTQLSDPEIQLAPDEVAEGEPAGTSVGALSVLSTNGTFSFELVSGTGSDDNGSFTLGGNNNSNLLTAAEFDYETDNEYSIRVKATESGGGGLMLTNTFTIDVTNVTEPTRLYARCEVLESGGSGQLVGTVQGRGDTALTYGKVAGYDGASFSINGSSGELTFTPDPSGDLIGKKYYVEVSVDDTDGGTSPDDTMLICVEVVNALSGAAKGTLISIM